MIEKIKEYWENQAKEHVGKPTATLNDTYLRKLEIDTFINKIAELDLKNKIRILDVGCGDGYSTLHIAQEYPQHTFLGVDYCENMIKNAQGRIKKSKEKLHVIDFKQADVLKLSKTVPENSFDLAMSDRCIINLHTEENQHTAIVNIAKTLKKGGYYLAIENFMDGHNCMNETRRSVGLQDIPVKWHNIFFTEERFRKSVGEFFDILEINNFSSSYYLATRVLYAGMCKLQGKEPGYEHELYKIASKLPKFGNFSPIKLVVMRRK
ncbi:methyltransferase domain-containing protein [bacterium]|nr:methyltransferase domain-containing protein [bacterium]